jgi:preprotein translocase subunit YajC
MTMLAMYLQAAPGAGGPQFLIFLLPILGLFAYMMWSQSRRQKKWQAMLQEIKPGDKVVTSGGLSGAVMSVKDDAIVLRVPPDNIKLEVARSSVVTLTTAEGSKS